MDDRQPREPALGDEVRQLGSNLKAILEAAWESDERRKLQAEIASALTEVAAALSSSAKEMLEGPAGQKLQAEVEAWRQKVRHSDLHERAHTELLDALRKVNAELSALAARWRAAPDDSDPPGGSRGEA